MGSIDGVYATASAWRDNLEVVTLLFDPEEVTYADLVAKAQKFECATKVFAHSKSQLETAKQMVGSKAVMAEPSQRPRMAKASDQKYYLANSPLRSLPMCSFQMTKLNAAVGLRQSYSEWLSPRQEMTLEKILKKLKANPKALDGFISPSDDAQLGNYAAKLSAVLED